MSNFRRFLSRRWLLAFLGALALLFGLAMLHPYPRQSLFGPTIRGEPWCVWEDAVRHFAHREEYEKTFRAKSLRWMGIEPRNWKRRELFDDAEMAPLAAALLDDPDPKIRYEVLYAYLRFPSLEDDAALPALLRRLDDADPKIRMQAAWMVWKTAKDKRAVTVMLKELAAEERETERAMAAGFFAYTDASERAPEVFPELAKRIRDNDQPVRYTVMVSMRKFGAQGVPVLRKGLVDSDSHVRRQAAIGLGRLGIHEDPVVPLLIEILTAQADARDDVIEAAQTLGRLGDKAKRAVPALEKFTNRPDPNVRQAVADALRAIDPQRFRDLQAERKQE